MCGPQDIWVQFTMPTVGTKGLLNDDLEKKGAGTSGTCSLFSSEMTGHSEDTPLMLDTITVTGELGSLQLMVGFLTSQLLQPSVTSISATDAASINNRIVTSTTAANTALANSHI